EASGVDFTFYKKPTIARRIARRMASKKIERLSEYGKDLQGNRDELDALQKKVLPRILAGKRAGDGIRIWVPGCSTGEEAYSVAICLLESLGDQAASTPIQIFASDISEKTVDRARGGVYPK